MINKHLISLPSSLHIVNKLGLYMNSRYWGKTVSKLLNLTNSVYNFSNNWHVGKFWARRARNLADSSDAIECLCIEILNRHSKNLILNLSYRPPQGDSTLLEKHLQDLLLRHDVCKKEVLITVDFNINLLDFESSKKVQSFVNLMVSLWNGSRN